MTTPRLSDEFGFDDEGEPTPLNFCSPEQRCICKEEMTHRLKQIGLTDPEIEAFFVFTQSPEDIDT